MCAQLHIRCPVSSLREALSEVIPVVPSRTTLPALECIHFRCEGDTTTLTATNLDLRISVRCPTTVLKSGEALIPAKILWETVRSLERAEELSLHADNTSITLETNYGRYTMAGLPPEEFPTGERSPEPALELPAEVIQRLVRHVLFAASEDPVRLALTGILWEFRADGFTAVATDGYRLSRLHVPAEIPQQGSILVPAETVELLRRVTEPLRVGWDDTTISLIAGSTTIVGRLIGEKFPAYEQVIPTTNSRRCFVERERLLSAIERVALFSPSQARIIRLLFQEGGITLQAEDESRGDRAQEVVACDYSGGELLIGFNAHYLSEALKAAHAERLLLEFSEPTKPVVIRWAESEALPVLESPLVILVMPVRL
ncbi:MAG: DNA polymerase III subunit beta [Candidatus Kapabacteria bacterium]|nr:DNA polymerase III subunit beta [Candidatus Kapabacteria bacterium]MCS7169023.1 DNA polymerase III subunit beta [Candidatus Kapabacteria bacterium]MDW7997116.1 DNA polymerase III subunit beta [Bacteroidota bacterium]MDW8225769.1 DNA polymerase III subunit beta [Bacteroidota bacterium]